MLTHLIDDRHDNLLEGSKILRVPKLSLKHDNMTKIEPWKRHLLQSLVEQTHKVFSLECTTEAVCRNYPQNILN